MIKIAVLGDIGSGKSHIAKQFGNQIENGKMMFIYQAQLAFKIWHNLLPKIDNKLLD